MRWQMARLLPSLLWRRIRKRQSIDLLVTHSPPYGIHDRPDRAHTGFRVFRQFINALKPRYLLHGHVHVYRQDVPRVTRVEQTTVINVYPYRVIEISSDGDQAE
jgi:Icc-related predicted phosphoesterase